ncbi:A disintegrin and metalloproteinase with thrombospondin motifs like [Dermacentor albipictus]|uniref:A disintegrin and metalloproteinase with thrombospondin motifs like n=1 Tax=Dermacentor albipictus TaxID=60249 RepID=UPI0031FC0D16
MSTLQPRGSITLTGLQCYYKGKEGYLVLLPNGDVNSGETMQKLVEYAEQYPPMWGSDLLLLLTGKPLSETTQDGKTSRIHGVANSEGACGPNNVLIVSDQGKDDHTSFALAHEISHAIGAVHDGEGTADSCFDIGYIMSPYMIPSANLSYSPCSIVDIEKFLGEEASDCLFKDTGDPQLDANRAAHCTRFLAKGQKLQRTEIDGACSFSCCTGRKSSFRLPERDGKPCNKFDASQMCNDGNCI